jgi:aspartyl-tRNA(Asn)/glutamyl-tRNA(Gln) amidotransferase subunit C
MVKKQSMDKETVRKAARLGRIEVAEADLDGWAKQLSGILKWIEQLQEVKTDGVEPLANVVDIDLALRKDAVNDGGDPDKVLSNAPESVEGYYVVPKVVE